MSDQTDNNTRSEPTSPLLEGVAGATAAAITAVIGPITVFSDLKRKWAKFPESEKFLSKAIEITKKEKIGVALLAAPVIAAPIVGMENYFAAKRENARLAAMPKTSILVQPGSDADAAVHHSTVSAATEIAANLKS